MLNTHTPVSTVCDTRVTTHLALRDKAEHSEHERVFCQWAPGVTYFMQNLRGYIVRNRAYTTLY